MLLLMEYNMRWLLTPAYFYDPYGVAAGYSANKTGYMYVDYLNSSH